jgi:hypothetical protein
MLRSFLIVAVGLCFLSPDSVVGQAKSKRVSAPVLTAYDADGNVIEPIVGLESTASAPTTASFAWVLTQIEDSLGTSHLLLLPLNRNQFATSGLVYFDQPGCTGNAFLDPVGVPVNFRSSVLEYSLLVEGVDPSSLLGLGAAPAPSNRFLYVATSDAPVSVTVASRRDHNLFCFSVSGSFDMYEAELVGDLNELIPIPYKVRISNFR